MTLYVDEANGRLWALMRLVQIPGIGIIGMQTLMDDYRDVDGMQIAFHTLPASHPRSASSKATAQGRDGCGGGPGKIVPGSVVAHGGEQSQGRKEDEEANDHYVVQWNRTASCHCSSSRMPRSGHPDVEAGLPKANIGKAGGPEGERQDVSKNCICS